MLPKVLQRLRDSENLFESNLLYLFYVGLWPDEDLSKPKKIIYKFFEYSQHLFSIIFLIISGVGTFQINNDLTLILANIDKSIVAYNYFIKVIIFTIKRNELKNLINDIIESGDEVTEKSKRDMFDHLMLITGLNSALMIIFSTLGLLQGEMTIEAWMPFDAKKDKMTLATSAQILALLFCIPFSYRAIGMQGIVCSLLIYLCDQLVDLQGRLRNLKYEKGFEIVMKRELKTILKKHIRLMRYATSIEKMFKEYFLVQNLAVTMELCLNAMVVTVTVGNYSRLAGPRGFTCVTPDPGNIRIKSYELFQTIIYVGWEQKSLFAGFIAFLGLALLNAFIYCYLGHELMDQSEQIAQAAFDADWTGWPVDMQKSILLIINVAQRPFQMSAGGIAVINMETYGTALYNGYSIFAVLNDVVN